MFICENCGKEHDGSFGSGRFCCKKCASAYSSKQQNHTFNKIDYQHCQYCGKVCKNKNSLVNHERLCDKNPLAQDKTYLRKTIPGRGGWNNGLPAWNSGLTKETDIRVQHISDGLKRHKALVGPLGIVVNNNPAKRVEVREKISKSMREVYSKKEPRTHQHRTKSGWCKGVWCDSSWELAYFIYNVDNDITILRTNDKFKYEYNGSIHSYFPDFYLPDLNTYVEIKGYITEKDNSKFSQFPLSLEVIDSSKISTYYEYTVMKYGDNFWEVLYER